MSDARSEIGRALEDRINPEQLKVLLDEVLSITKSARGWCPNCKKAVMVEIADAKSVVSAMTDLANQAWGRPGESSQEESGVTFVRNVYAPDGAMLGTGWGEEETADR